MGLNGVSTAVLHYVNQLRLVYVLYVLGNQEFRTHPFGVVGVFSVDRCAHHSKDGSILKRKQVCFADFVEWGEESNAE